MFEIYVGEVEIEDSHGNKEKYKINPLPGKYLSKLYDIMGKFENAKDEELSISAFDEKTVSLIHEVCLETFKQSYPNEKEELLDKFVSQNLMKIMEAVFKVNMKAD